MRIKMGVAIAAVMALSMGVSGCSEERQMIDAANLQTDVVVGDVQTAINYSKLYTTNTEKLAYLVYQGRAFYKKGDYERAANLASYILDNVDSNSQMAKELLTAARDRANEALTESVSDNFSADMFE